MCVLINLFIYLFIYLWLHWVFIAAHGLSLVAVSGGYSLLWCTGFSLRWLLLLRSMGSRRTGFSSCGARASVVVTRGLWSTGSVVAAHGISCSVACGIFPDQSSNPCPLHWQAILNHCTTREVPHCVVLTCISQMTTDVEHLFIRLLALCLSSLEKCLFKSFASLCFCFTLLPTKNPPWPLTSSFFPLLRYSVTIVTVVLELRLLGSESYLHTLLYQL